MSRRITQSELEAYLEEALPPEEMAAIEQELRARPELLTRLSAINGRRDAGVHSVGEIWRRTRLSCPSREHLGSFLLAALDDERRFEATLDAWHRDEQTTANGLTRDEVGYCLSALCQGGRIASQRNQSLMLWVSL